MTDAARRSPMLPRALFLVVLVALLLNLPERTYGDDLFYVWVIVRDRAFTPHFLFTPLARGWTWALAQVSVDPLLALRLLAAVSTALGTALLAAAARRRGASDLLATAIALVVLTSSATWFFAGAAEVHGVQLCAFGLLAWVAAGLRPDCSPLRVLALALTFGVAVGAHRSSGILLPGVLAAYAVFTPGRARGPRLRDVAGFAVGGVISLATMLLVQRQTTGEAISTHDDAGYWMEGLTVRLGQLDTADLASYLAHSWVAPAFALTVLGAFALGSLARRQGRLALALAVTLLPHAVFFTLFQWEERGAYFVVTLPLLAWAAARVNAFGGAAMAVAALGALFTPSELVAFLGTTGLLAAVGLAFAAGLAFARHALVSPARGAWLVLVLAACQLIGSQRELSRWDSETPILDWGRDAVETTGADSVIVVTGFPQYSLLLLLDRPWPPPYQGTWDYAESLPGPGPIAFDIGAIAPKSVEGVARMLAEGKRVFVLESVFRHFEHDRLRGEHVRALRESYDLVEVRQGRFEAFELGLRSD